MPTRFNYAPHDRRAWSQLCYACLVISGVEATPRQPCIVTFMLADGHLKGDVSKPLMFDVMATGACTVRFYAGPFGYDCVADMPLEGAGHVVSGQIVNVNPKFVSSNV